MKNKLIFGTIFIAIISVSLILFYPKLASIAENNFSDEGDEPDMPGFMKTGVSKEEFMISRAQNIGLLRGIDEKNPPDPTAREAAVAQMERQQSRLTTIGQSNETDFLLAPWTPIGPAPIPNGQTSGTSTAVSGRVSAIAVHPSNANIVYVGAAQGGVYRSTDGGANWTPLLDNASTLSIGAIAIAPSQPETIYVGTGEPNFSSDSFFGVGVYRIDNASSASPIITGPLNKNAANADIFSGRAIGEIVVHPSNPATIFVGSAAGVAGLGGFDTIPFVLPSRGIYRSTNATSASPVFAKLTGLEAGNDFDIRDIAIDPLNPNLLVCNLIANGGGIYVSTNALAASPAFIRRATFNGTTYSDLTAEFAIQHTVGNANPTIYAATGNFGGRVLINTDGGTTWTQQIDNDFCAGQCFYDIAIGVAPNNPARVYLGGSPNLIFGISTTSGTSFTASNFGLHADSQAIAVSSSTPSTIYFGTDGGIYKSIDSGASWAILNNNSFSATQFMSIAVHPTDPNFTIGGTQDNGTNFFRPNGTWTRADFGDGGYSLIDQNATDTTNVRMYHTYFNNGGLMGYGTVASTATASDGNWTFRGCQAPGTTGNGITCSGAVLFYAPLEQGPGNPNTVYFGTDRLYRSTDAGLSHTVVSQNPLTAGVPISAIGISRQNDNVRIVGQANGGIFGTSSGSTTLTNLDAGNAVPNAFIARAVIDPNNVSIAYVSLSAFGITNVWRTTNFTSGNPTWTAAAGSGGTALPQVPVSAFVVDPTSSATLYAGTDIGVYVSTNSGASWSPFGTGLPRVAVFDMAVTANPNRKLRIATHGRGLWETTLAGCTYSLNPTSHSISAIGGSRSIQVTSPAGCNWIAVAAFLAESKGENDNPNLFVLPLGFDLINPLKDIPLSSSAVQTVEASPAANYKQPAAKLEISGNPANAPTTTFPGTGVGAIPDGLAGTPPQYGAPLNINFSVSGITAPISSVSADVTLSHTWAGDVDMVLKAPGGAPSQTLVSRIGVTTAGSFGSASDYSGNYNFTDAATGTNIWTAATATPIPQGSYRTTAPGQTGQTDPAPVTNLTATFTGLTTAQINGTWTLTVRDAASADIGSVSAANLTIVGGGGGGNWITITSGSSGTGNGTVEYTVSANPNTSPRTGTITVGGEVHTVNQSGIGPTIRRPFDFDGDGKTDISIFRPSVGEWWINRSSNGSAFAAQFGSSTDRITPGDFTGDGKTDIAFWRPSTGFWFVLRSEDFSFFSFPYGTNGDIPATGDYDNDGKADAAVFRPSNSTWFIRRSTDGGSTIQQFGQSGDVPVAADYDGDGKTDIAIYRPSLGQWWLNRSTAGIIAFQFGNNADKCTPGDYTGDGKTDVAFWRPSTGFWFVLRSEDQSFFSFPYGTNGDTPAPGDYDGDGKHDAAVFRSSGNTWFIRRSTDGGSTIQGFGIAGDRAVPNAYVVP